MFLFGYSWYFTLFPRIHHSRRVIPVACLALCGLELAAEREVVGEVEQEQAGAFLDVVPGFVGGKPVPVLILQFPVVGEGIECPYSYAKVLVPVIILCAV